MDFLRSNGYTTITPFQLLNWMQYDTPLPIRPILVTMDDNYIPVVDEVFPILQARGMVAVNFAHTNYMGVVTGNGDHGDWNECMMMEAAGNVLTESHTKSHTNLTTLNAASAQQEIEGSKAAIDANMTGKNCQYIAYPYGAYNATHVTMCQNAGYRAAFTTADQLCYRSTPRYEIGRTTIGSENLSAFMTKIAFPSLPPAPPGLGWTIDNLDANCTVNTTDWPVTAGGGSYGTNYVSKAAGDGSRKVRWAAMLPQAGTYRVHAWWNAAGGRATNATYQVTHSGGTSNVVANQQANGAKWNFLGQWSFSTVQPADVTLSDAANGSVSADAIWFEPVSLARVENFELY
jgi:peptidoglycan/xylan/chitin deacetylase (PgdA/CDA1 family)